MVAYPKRAASSAIPEEGIFLFVCMFALSVLKHKNQKRINYLKATDSKG